MAASKPATEKAIFLGDVHFPYQDDAALTLVDEFMDWYGPDYIYVIGDIADCYQWSSFDKDPRRILQTQDDIDQAADWLARIRKNHKKAKMFFHEGNHEHRLQKTVYKVPEFASMNALTWQKLLRLDELDIHFTPYMGKLTHRGFLVEHGDLVSQNSSATAAKLLQRRGTSGISGHVHRLGVSYKTTAKGTHVWYENGCLCRLDPTYTKYPDWQQGFSVGGFLKHQDSKRFVIEQVPILDRSIYFAERYWSA